MFICIIYKQIKNKEDAIKLQQDIDDAGKWEQDWLMHFHPDKCTVKCNSFLFVCI
jgi:hypothetical protein